jgi:hypothetical protein
VTVTRDFVRRLAAAAATITLVALLGTLLFSAAVAPSSNWIVRAGLIAFCALAVARPDLATLVTIALAGFGIIISHLAGMPSLRTTEVLIVGSLAGFCVRCLVTPVPFRRALADSLSAPVVLFAVAAVASAAVWQRVYQLQLGDATTYFQALLRVVTRDYFVAPGDFAVLVTTAVILEGLALYVLMKALCRIDSTFFDRALRMLVVGGAGLGVMSIVRLGEILLRNPAAIQMLRETSVGLRISPQIPDYIAAGAYFSLCWVASLGIALADSRRRLVWLMVGAPLVAGLYLTGSRSVIGAAVAGLLVPGFFVLRQRGKSVRAVVAFAVAIVLVMAFSYSWMSGRDLAGELARQSLTVRGELLRAGTRVIATRPTFGVGLDRFYLLAGDFASPELRSLWPGRMNPHNDFLRFGAELGLIGLGLFLWILIAAAVRIGRDLVTSRDARLAGLTGGVVAFLVTGLFSNPLMVREVSYVFWIGLGLAVGHGVRRSPATDGQREGTSAETQRWKLAANAQPAIARAIGLLLLGSIPSRVHQELATINPASVSDGFFDWEVDPDGTRWRWSGAQATMFVDRRAQVVEIPLSSVAPQPAQHVEIRVDGRPANRIQTSTDWQRVRILLAADSGASRRIDLTVSPTWVPSETSSNSVDRRPHGVRVGEIHVIRASAQPR